MANLRHSKHGRVQASVRKRGCSVTKTFASEHEAKAWAEWVEDIIERFSMADFGFPLNTAYFLDGPNWSKLVDKMSRRPNSWVDRAWNGVRTNGKVRAARKAIDFGVEKSDIVDALKRSGGFCEVTGIPFSRYDPTGGGQRTPFAPSIDRIDASRGYTPDNIRAVCFATNMALSHWGEGVFHILCSGFTYKNIINGDIQAAKVRAMAGADKAQRDKAPIQNL